MNYSALSRSVSFSAKCASYLCSSSSSFAYPTKVFPSGPFLPYLLLLTTSRFVELSFAPFVPMPTPPFSHSPVASSVSRLGSSSVLLSFSSFLLSCSSDLLSCFSLFLCQDISPSTVHVFVTWPFCCLPWHMRLKTYSLLFPRQISICLVYLSCCLFVLLPICLVVYLSCWLFVSLSVSFF